jgi:sec-independent protein translocase protein TatA
MGFGMPELLIVLAIVVVLFGATKLPQLGKGLGEAIGNFKKAQKDAERQITRDEVDATPQVEAKRPADKLE